MTLEEARAWLAKRPTEWELADAILADVYPNWPHIPNHGLLRGAIAAVVKVMREQPAGVGVK